VKKVKGEWQVESPAGKIKVQFTKKNKMGIVDHVVTLDSGISFNNPMRVIPHEDGCEVVFTLLSRDNMTEQQFEIDSKMIQTDLNTLKQLFVSLKRKLYA
jgi:hypothetical protein